MNLDEQLREVYAGLASHAPHPDRIMAGIAGRARAHRQRRILLGVGAAAAAAAAVGVPTVLLRDAPTPIEALLRPVRGRGYPMPFTPSWIPEGYRLDERRITTDRPGRQQRVWRLNPPMMFPDIRFELELSSPSPIPSAAVDLDGTPASLRQEKHLASCSWQPIPGVQVTITMQKQPDEVDSGPEYAQTVLRIARSAVSGPPEYLQPTLSFGWLPDQVPLRRVFARFYSGDQPGDVILAGHEQAGAAIVAGVGDRLPEDVHLEQWEKTMVRGRPAWYRQLNPQGSQQGAGEFYVELTDGRWLSATGSSRESFTITKPELIRIIDSISLPS